MTSPSSQTSGLPVSSIPLIIYHIRHIVKSTISRFRQGKNGFYDPELNAVFLHSAGDSRDDGTIWVYRHRRAGQ